MKMFIPSDIGADDYTTNVPETDYAEFDINAIYELEGRCIVKSEHNVYESLKSANKGNVPTGKTDENWTLVGKTNAYKGIDNKLRTQTVHTQSIVIELATLKCYAFALLNVECSSVKLEILKGDDVVYTEELRGYKRFTTGWLSFFIGKFTYQKNFIFEHPIVLNGRYRITLIGDVIKYGFVLRGQTELLGKIAINPGDSFDDFSKYTDDGFGDTTLKQGVSRDWIRSELTFKTVLYARIRQLFRERRGKLTLYIPTTAEDLVILGYAQKPEMLYSGDNYSACTLDIQGVS